MEQKAIAIDGPAGAGKSTVAKLVAGRLGYTYIDTGAMYRAVAWKVLETKQPVTDELIKKVAADIRIELTPGEQGTTVLVDGRDVSQAIRTPTVTKIVSQVAQLGDVRRKLVELQRQMAAKQPAVMDGRDIGTKVLPQAGLKIFLTASIEARAKRRWLELRDKGHEVPLNELQEDIARRDKADSERAISPLTQAPDAILVDTTDLTIEQVVERILSLNG